MKKLTVIIIIGILISVFSFSIQASDIVFHETELKEALQDYAYMMDKEIIFAGDLTTKVSGVFDDQDFEKGLKSLLAGTDYHWTFDDGYYLVGDFAEGSPLMAAMSETAVFQPQYRNGYTLVAELNQEGVEIKYLESKNLLIVQALPEKLQEIKAEYERLDSPDNPYQVEYSLKIIELTEGFISETGLNELILSSEESEVQFFSKNRVLETGGFGHFSLINFDAALSSERIYLAAEPNLVTAFNHTARMEVIQETILAQQGSSGLDHHIVIELTPERITADKQRINSQVNIEITGSSELNTNIWTASGETVLVGIINFAEEKRSGHFYRNRDEKRQRSCALYLSASSIGSLPVEERNAFSLDGFDVLMGEEKSEINYRERLQVFWEQNSADGGINYELSALNKERKWGFDLRVHNPANTLEMLQLGPDFYVIDDLRLLTRLQMHETEDTLLKLGLGELLDISESFSLSADYFPLIYNVNQRQTTGDSYWSAEGEIRSAPLFLNLKYTTENNMQPLQGMLGSRLIGNMFVVAGASGNERSVEKVHLGLRFELWE